MQINQQQYDSFVQVAGAGELQAYAEVAGTVFVSFYPTKFVVRLSAPPKGIAQKLFRFDVGGGAVVSETDTDFARLLGEQVADFFSFRISSTQGGDKVREPYAESELGSLKIHPQHLNANTGETKKAGSYQVKLWRQSATRFVLTVVDAGRRRDYDIRDGQVVFPVSQKQSVMTALNFLGIQFETETLSEVAVNLLTFAELPDQVTVRGSDGTEHLRAGDVVEINKPLKYIVVYRGGSRDEDDPPFFYYAKGKLRPRAYPEDEPMLRELVHLLGIGEDAKVGYACEDCGNSYEECDCFWEMATLRKHKSGLPANLHVDDSGLWKKSGHGRRIKFQPNKGDHAGDTRDFISVSIEESPKVFYKSKVKLELSQAEVGEIVKWVKLNRGALEKLADEEIDFEDFMRDMRRS